MTRSAVSKTHRRTIRRMCRIALSLGLWLGVCPLPLTKGTVAQESPVGSTADDAARRRLMLPQHTPRHRRLRETLATVDQHQAAGRSGEALKTVQWLLDQPFDTFAFIDNQPPQSVKRLAQARLRSFPEEWQRQYERIYGLEARQMVAEAQARDDEGMAIEVLRRFGATAAAGDAKLFLALRWLDRGDAKAALSVLLPSVVDTESIDRQSSSLLAVIHRAATSAGEGGIARMAASELAEREILLQDAPERTPAEEPRAPPFEQLIADGEHAGPYLRDAVPVLRPEWEFNLVSVESSPHLADVLEAWRGNLQELNLAPVSPIAPLVVRDQVILREYEGVCGIDAASGKRLWAFRCESSASNWIDEAARHGRLDIDRGQMLPSELLQWWLSTNTLMGRLTSDGIRLYAVDSLSHPAVKLGGRGDPFQNRTDGPRPREFNRILALQLPNRVAVGAIEPPKLVWSQGRSLRAPEPPGDERYFLGPPLPHAGRLFAVAEMDREIRLVALQAETGEIIWEQPLAAVDRSAVNDGERAFVACEPVPAGDLILCPTQAGVLAAVDYVTGALAWAYYDGDLPLQPQSGRQRNAVIARGRPGFAPRTLVQRDRVLHLPMNSSQLHCVSRATGTLEWSAPRQRAASIAAVTDDVVVLLEDRSCRALRLQDGSEAWKQSLPAVTGTGFAVGTNYLIPLDRGRFALIDLATGNQQAWQPPRPDVALGNLTACGNRVYSMGPQGLTSFLQIQSVHRYLDTQSDRLSPADRIAWDVDLKLAQADMRSAEQALERGLRLSVPAGRISSFQGMLREILYHRLETDPVVNRDVLEPLQQLAVTPDERGRFLSRQARRAAEAKDLPQLRAALRHLSELPMSASFVAADEDLSQSASAACRQILAEVQTEFPEFVREFRQELLDGLAPPGAAADDLSLWRFALRVSADDEQVGPFRNVLAQRLSHQGQRHAAELLWQQNRFHADPHLRAEAVLGLSNLSAAAGWSRDAAILLNEAADLDPRLKLRSEQTVMEIIARSPALDEARQWRERLHVPRGSVRSAAVRLVREPELPDAEILQKMVDQNRRATSGGAKFGEFSRRLSPAEPLTAEVLVRMQGPQTSLLVVDASVSQIVRQWPLPARHSHPWPGHAAIQGHFFPIGGTGELRGYSLLELAEETPVWTQRPDEVQQRRAVPLIGPAGATFVSFQSQNLLLVCDPWDGSLLWQRRDLEPGGGLYMAPDTGIAGDERCLAVFGPDRLSYITYDTTTGRQLHEGRLETEPRQFRRAFGRKIFSVSQARGRWQARVWDPLINDWSFQEQLNDRNFATMAVGSSEVAWLSAEGNLRAYDVPTGKTTLDIPWREVDGLNSMRLMTDGPRTYVNLQRNGQIVQTLREYNYAAGDTVVPCLHLRDDLYAIDRATGRILWKRAVPSRTLLKLEPAGLPFLVLASKVRDQHDNNQQSLLVEVLDAETGDLLARHERLPADRIVSADYDAAERLVRLIGQKTEIEIHFSVGGMVAAER